MVNQTGVRWDGVLPAAFQIQAHSGFQHRSLLRFAEVAEEIEAPYQRTDLDLKLSRTLSDWRGQVSYQRRRLDAGTAIPYRITDSGWGFRLQHRIRPWFGWHATWMEQQLHYRIGHTEPDVPWGDQASQASESIREWRLTAQVNRFGLWNPFVAYEQISRGSNQVGVTRLGVMGGTHLGRGWTLQLYAFTRNRPRQEIVASGDQMQAEFLPERQQASCIISLRRRLTASGGIEARWRWSQDKGASSHTYVKHVLSLAYCHQL